MLTGKNLISATIAFTSMANATTMLAGTATGPSSSASPYVVNVPATVVSRTQTSTIS